MYPRPAGWDRPASARSFIEGDTALPRPPMQSKPGLVDRQPQPVSPDQLVMRQATLQVLGDHVSVLEVPLERMVVVDGRRAGEVVGRVDDLRRLPDRVGRGQSQGGALVQRDRTG